MTKRSNFLQSFAIAASEKFERGNKLYLAPFGQGRQWSNATLAGTKLAWFVWSPYVISFS